MPSSFLAKTVLKGAIIIIEFDPADRADDQPKPPATRHGPDQHKMKIPDRTKKPPKHGQPLPPEPQN